MENDCPKVRILTRRAGYNFGSALQAFALQRAVEKAGFPNLVLNYDEYRHNLRWRIRPAFDNTVWRIFQIVPFVKCLFASKYRQLYYRDIQRRKFDEMDEVLLKKTTSRCATGTDLAREMEGCYACICGSDQIWNPFFFDRNFYLEFITDDRVKKISYAPSLGIYNDEQCTPEMAELISRFDSISVREERGSEIVRKKTGREVKTLLDPTLLLERDEWDLIKKEYPIDGEYILCYFLGQNNIPHDFISRLKKSTALPVINVQMYYNINCLRADRELYDVGPREFLSLVAKASYICTDSFHGTIFSYIYGKDFFVFDRFGEGELRNENSRIDMLMEILNLKERRKKEGSPITAHELKAIDYTAITPITDKIAESFDYLQQALAGGRQYLTTEDSGIDSYENIS